MTSTHSSDDWFDEDLDALFCFMRVMYKLNLAGIYEMASVQLMIASREQNTIGEL